MGLRERLEVIRENNRDVEGRPELGFNPLEIGAEKGGDPPRGRPWLSMWFRPRETIRHVALFGSEWAVLGLGAAAGSARALNRAASRDLGDRFPLEVIVAGCLILGPILQLISIYLGGVILRWCGALFGGKASFAEVRAALAWGALPQAAMLLPWMLAVGVFGGEMFVRVKPILSTYPPSWVGFFLFYALDLILVIWSLVLTLNALAAVFRMRIVWVVLACLVAGCVMVGGAVLGYFVWSNTTVPSFDLGRFTTTEKPAPGPRPRKSIRPSPAIAPEAALLWDQGYSVSIRDPFGRKEIYEVELGADIRPGVTDEAIRYICMYKDVGFVVIKDASGVTDEGLAYLARLPKLMRLHIDDAPQITDGGLEQLRSLPKLEDVQLSNCPRVTGEGLTSLGEDRHGAYEGKKYGLYDFALSNGRVSPVGLRAIAAAPPPHHLSLVGMQVGDVDLVHLVPIAHLYSLTLRDNQIEGPGLASLVKVSGLRELDLSGNPLTDEAVSHLAKMSDLLRLNLARTPISPSAIQVLRKALPKAKIRVEEGPRVD